MHICVPLQNFCTNGHYAPQCHSIYRTQTHMPQLIMTILMSMPLECCISWQLRLQKEVPTFCWPDCLCPQWCQELVAPCHCHLWSWQWLIPGASHCRGQYQHAHDHICEHHPDAISHDTSITNDVSSTSTTSLPAPQALRSTTHITPITLAAVVPAATSCTLWKPLPIKSSPQHIQTQSTGVSPSSTGIAQAAPHHSAKSGSYHLRLSWKYRPRSFPTDEPDDAMTQTAPVTTIKCSSKEVIHDNVAGWLTEPHTMEQTLMMILK